MTALKLLILLVFVSFYSCGQTQKRKTNSDIIRLTTHVVTLANQLNNPDSCKQGLLYLDSATAIDNNCFSCYYEKLIFFFSLKRYDKVFSTLDTCIKLKPNAQDLYLTKGILHERLGDTTLSKPYFKKSLTICNSVLDTMNTNNRDYVTVTTNKAINLIMLGDSTQANQILKHLYDTQPDDPKFDNIEKKYTLSLMNKSRAQLLDTLSDLEKYSH